MPFRTPQRARRIARDYHKPKYGNPLFPRSGNGRRSSRQDSRGGGRAFLYLLGAAGLGLGWYLIWGPALRITSVEVAGASGPAEEALREGVAHHMEGSFLGILPRANILFFSRGDARADIGSRVMVDKLVIRKKLPHTLAVSAEERVVRAALDRSGQLFALDESGAVIRELSEGEIAQLGELPPGMNAVATQGLGAEVVDVAGSPSDNRAATKATALAAGEASSMPLIMLSADSAATDAGTGTAAVPAAAMRLILQAHTRLADVAHERARWFVVQPASETVEASMQGGWRALFNTALPFDIQSERLGIILKDKVGSRLPTLEYVDLRYNERIFLRFKDGSNG